MMDSRLNQVLTVILGTTLVLSVLGVVYISGAPPPPSAGDEFTELYIIGANGTASDYPERLVPGEKEELIVGIVNHEARTVTYQLTVRWNETVSQQRQVKLNNEERWERPITIVAPEQAGTYWLSIELDIPQREMDGSYRSVRILVRVQ